MAVNVIRGDKSKPAPEIVHPLLSNREAQIAVGTVFLNNKSGDHLISTLNTRTIPHLCLNKVCAVSGDGQSWQGVVFSYSLVGNRQGSASTISLRRRV